MIAHMGCAPGATGPRPPSRDPNLLVGLGMVARRVLQAKIDTTHSKPAAPPAAFEIQSPSMEATLRSTGLHTRAVKGLAATSRTRSLT